MPTKKCTKCKESLPTSCFGNLSSSSDGLMYRCRPCIKVDKAEFKKANPEKVKRWALNWQKANPEKAAAIVRRRTKKWNDNNRQRCRENTKGWFDKNPSARAFYSAQRRQVSIIQTIAMNEEQVAEIKSIYKRAKSISEETGVLHHVDHIIPLKAKMCSGLHVPWNLQIITAQENVRKNNRMPIDVGETALL